MNYELKQLSIHDSEDVFRMLKAIPAEENGFMNPAAALTAEEFPAWLASRAQEAERTDIADGWRVPQAIYWLYADGKPVGMGKLRYFLTDALREAGGNIGYAIRPSARRKGFGTILLRELMKEAAKLGISRALVTVHNGNEASIRVALRNGGALEKVNETRHFIWVECTEAKKNDSVSYAK